MTKRLHLPGVISGLSVTFKTMLKPAVTVQYPHEREDPPTRARGVIALKEENCTVCMLCARSCPDWCIYIEGHKEKRPPRREGGRDRTVSVLDRFDIDYALCMYCGICVEVCPFDALFWSPEFEYSEYDIREMTHEKDRLEEWTYKVLPPPELEVGAEPPDEVFVAQSREAPSPVLQTVPTPHTAAVPTAATAAATPAPATVVQATPGPTPEQATPNVASQDEVTERPTAPGPHEERVEVEPDQATYDRVLAEQLAQGRDRRVAEGQAKRAAMLAARKKAQEG
jgi:NADH-quinone oxidoreductase subunit I